MYIIQYWAAIVVASNYVLVITLYPAILMIHHRWIKKYEDPLIKYTCCLCCTLYKKSSEQQGDEETSPEPQPDTGDDAFSRRISVKDGAGETHEYRAMERFLGMTWSKWMDRAKIYNVIFFAILFIVALCLALTQLEPEDATNYVTKSTWLYDLTTALRQLNVFQRCF